MLQEQALNAVFPHTTLQTCIVHLIRGSLEYVSWKVISSVTDAVIDEVTAWQARPLEAMYPVVFVDALRVKMREDGVVRNKAVYLALGVLPDGTRDILGLWIENTEGAKFWMKVFNDLKTRGTQDILIAVTDGLKGMGAPGRGCGAVHGTQRRGGAGRVGSLRARGMGPPVHADRSSLATRLGSGDPLLGSRRDGTA